MEKHDESNVDDDVCKPIKNLTELYNYMKNPPYWAKLTIPRAKRSKGLKTIDLYSEGNVCHYDKDSESADPPSRFEYDSLPKTLVCHDMMNGYHDDSHINGTDNYAAYSFYHWAAIDIFVYFSHHFISIPPLAWINVAHKHGVQILGTIITEWEPGFEICEKFLQSEEEMLTFVHHLVTVAKYFKLDGWLLNIENKVGKVEMLVKFVEHLTSRMHHEIPDSVVIWYDSVTNEGALSWQNCLNKMNKEFFNACDGIFTNYCWAESDLECCVKEAGARLHDVYVGVDIWGRNFWGGGCFNTVEAVKVIYKFGLSMALFAPAWTHENIEFHQIMDQQAFSETHDTSKSCTSQALEWIENNQLESEQNAQQRKYFKKCAVREHFFLRENALWNSIWAYLNTKGPSQLPFQTFFCLGSGVQRNLNGEVIEKKLWFNLREQEYQLSVPFCKNSFILEKEITAMPESKKSVENKPEDREKREAKDEICEESKSNDLVTSGDQDPIVNSTCEIEPKITQYSNDDFLDSAKVNESTCINCDLNEIKLAESVQEVVSEVVVKKTIEDSESTPPKRMKPPVQKFKVIPNLENPSCITLYNKDSYNGGGCISISSVKSPMAEISNNHKMRLFLCEFLCDYNFIVYYAVKPQDEAINQDLNLIVKLKNNKSGNIFDVNLGDETSGNELDTRKSREIFLNPVIPEKFKILQINLLESYPNFYIPIENETKWKIRYFSLEFPNSTMLEINCELTQNEGSVLLGALGVTRDVLLF